MNWKLTTVYCFLVFMLVSCRNDLGSLKRYIKNSDSASVAFFSNDTTIQIVIRDHPSIEKLGSFIDGSSMEPGKCTDTGSIWFFEGGKKKLQVDFSMNPDCSYFSYMMNDKVYAKVMSEEATEYLNGVKQIATATL